MNAQDVADWLQRYPEFFDEHASLFATLTVPHPHGGRAIPLAERQMLTLREKNRALELRVAELMRYGQENDAIAERLARWTRMLLLQRAARLLPETLTGSLEEIFSVPHVALVLWEAADEYVGEARAREASRELIDWVGLLQGPYCGAPLLEAAQALPLFDARPVQSKADDGASGSSSSSSLPGSSVTPITPITAAPSSASDVRSVALIPLRRGASASAFGLLALGSADGRRFHDGMGTEFLRRIGETSSAALTRLLH